jgi:hypothetical protein
MKHFHYSFPIVVGYSVKILNCQTNPLPVSTRRIMCLMFNIPHCGIQPHERNNIETNPNRILLFSKHIICRQGIYLHPCLPAYLSLIFVYLSIYLFVCLSICLSVCLSVYLSIYLSICLSIYLSIYLIYLSIYRSIYLSIYLLVYLFCCLFVIVCLSACQSVSLAVCLPVYLSPMLSFFRILSKLV